MAASYRGLLASWIGGASTVPTQAGYRSLLASWVGGAFVPSGTQAGYRSLLAPWIGGASVPPGVQAGFSSLMAMWMGGNVGGLVSVVAGGTPVPHKLLAQRVIRSRPRSLQRRR